MITEDTVRSYYRRLNHEPHGLTELVAIEKGTGRIAATGFFDNEDDFVLACRAYNQRCNVYAGRNPRPFTISGVRNCMNAVWRKRARDKDIRLLTAMSLDVDPVRMKGTPATPEQRETALLFVLRLQERYGGAVDDSGNGIYLWWQFGTPIEVDESTFWTLKGKCEAWQAMLRQTYKPEMHGLRIDGCHDLSRLKRVIGTVNHTAGRVSCAIASSEPTDVIRSELLAVHPVQYLVTGTRRSAPPLPAQAELPSSFQRLLASITSVSRMWETPDPDGDTSRHDWTLGMRCIEAGITEPNDLAAVLAANPHGKYRRDQGTAYLKLTLQNLLGEKYINPATPNTGNAQRNPRRQSLSISL